MANGKIKIEDDVREVLARAETNGLVLYLRNGQLDRKLYERVDKILSALGGKWNRRIGGHVFENPPLEVLAAALEKGSATDKKVEFQAFYTPPSLAEYVVGLADVKDKDVLEPSAGRGALAHECRAQGARSITCYEIDSKAIGFLQDDAFHSWQVDFLSIMPGAYHDVRFDRVVMNPPFTKGQDLKHVSHAIRFLREGGQLTAIIAGNITREPLRTLQAQYRHIVNPLPDKSFTTSGTKVRTALLRLWV